jgi:hypothetical protein
MSQSRKYRSFGIRRENNLSDIENRVQALNNLLDDLPGVDPEEDITFISEDLNPIRGLKDTSIQPDSFTQLAQTATRTSLVDEQGQIILDENNNAIQVLVNPLVRIEDRFKQFRVVTEDPPVFASGQGPRAFFIPSNLIPTFGKTTKIEDDLESDLTDSSVQVSDDFWVLGEFIINDRLRVNFPDVFGGILWEGFYIPNPAASIHTFLYETSGLFHVEYDRFNNGNWQVLKSIYAKKRDVLVGADTVDPTVLVLQEGESKYLSVGDFLDSDNTITIVSILNNVITLEAEDSETTIPSFTNGDTVTFDMPLGAETTTGQYTMNETVDRGETPQIKMQIFWWFPDESEYEPDLKYLRNIISGRSVFDYFFFNKEPAAATAAPGSVRELLNTAVVPSQAVMGESNQYREFKSSTSTETIYIPKSALSQVTKANINISFKEGNRSATGNFSATDLGNVIIPTDVADLGSVVPKNMQIKDLLGSNIAATERLVSKAWTDTKENYSVSIIDHNGLLDYFVASSSDDIVTVSDTSRLREDLLCITATSGVNAFIRITEIISATQFRTSANLNISNAYVFVYANAGILDRSLDIFCVGVFGQVLSTTATAGSNTLQLVSASGIANGQVVQFGDSITPGTTVTNVSGTTITLSNNLAQTINQNETIVFTPAGTSVNKEICVLPLDLSPPFIGVNTGLDTNEKNIRSSEATFNLKVEGLEFRNTTVNTATTAENYNRKISIANSGLSILARKV